MFTAILMMLIAGADAPAIYQTKERPFVTRSACEEWASDYARRLDRKIAALDEAKRPAEWEIRCVPLGTIAPSREA